MASQKVDTIFCISQTTSDEMHGASTNDDVLLLIQWSDAHELLFPVIDRIFNIKCR